MIPKEEREKDNAVLAADRLKGTWTNSDGKRKPGKSVFIAETAHEEKDVDGSGRPSRYGPTRDYVCNAFTVERAAAIALAHNRLPVYVEAAEEMERRIARIEAWHKASTDPEHGDPDERAEETLATVLKILRGGK